VAVEIIGSSLDTSALTAPPCATFRGRPAATRPKQLRQPRPLSSRPCQFAMIERRSCKKQILIDERGAKRPRDHRRSAARPRIVAALGPVVHPDRPKYRTTIARGADTSSAHKTSALIYSHARTARGCANWSLSRHHRGVAIVRPSDGRKRAVTANASPGTAADHGGLPAPACT